MPSCLYVRNDPITVPDYQSRRTFGIPLCISFLPFVLPQRHEAFPLNLPYNDMTLQVVSCPCLYYNHTLLSVLAARFTHRTISRK